MQQASNHITVIEPPRGIVNLRLGELWEYRDLIGLLVRRDFVAQYKQTILGPLWHILQPLFTTAIFTVIFGSIAKMSTDGASPFLFYMAGITCWSYFSGVLTTTANTFIGNSNLFGKVYFPRLVVPVANVISKLIGFTIQLCLFLCFVAYAYFTGSGGVTPNVAILLLPLLILALAVYALALGIIVSSLTTKYRDLAVALTFGVQLYMYITPIIYPVSLLPTRVQAWALANPLAPIIETFRFAFLGTGSLNPSALMYSSISILCIGLLGIALFNRVERTFMDTV